MVFFCFCQKISKNLFYSLWFAKCGYKQGDKKVSSKNINLETNKGINLDTNKVSDKVPEMRTGSGTNKSQDNKPEKSLEPAENTKKDTKNGV